MGVIVGIRRGIIKWRRGTVLRCHSIGDRDRCSLFGADRCRREGRVRRDETDGGRVGMYGGEGLEKSRGAAGSKNAGRVRVQGAPVVGR